MLEPSQRFIQIDQTTHGMFGALIDKLRRERTSLPAQTVELLHETVGSLNLFRSKVRSYEHEAGQAHGVVDRMGRAGRTAYDAFGQLVAQTNALAQQIDLPVIELPAEVRAVVRSLHQAVGQTVAHNDGVGRFVQGLPHAELENVPRLPEIGALMSTARWREKLPLILRSEMRPQADQIEQSLRDFRRVAQAYGQAQKDFALAMRDYTASPARDFERRENRMNDALAAATDSLRKAVAAFDSLAKQMPSIERASGLGRTFGGAGRELAEAIRQQQPVVSDARTFVQQQESPAAYLQRPAYTDRPAAGEVRLQLRPQQRVPRDPPPSYTAASPPGYSQNLPVGHRRGR